MRLENIREVNKKNILKAFDIVFENLHFTIKDVALCKSEKGHYLMMPRKSYKVGEETRYVDMIIWEKETYFKLVEDVLDCLKDVQFEQSIKESEALD